MKKSIVVFLSILMVFSLNVSVLPAFNVIAVDENTPYVDYVNPYIGTDYDSSVHKGGSEYGGMNPWVSTPFAMTKWTPQTRQNSISTMPYRYSDTRITGFMATHQPAIWMGDFGYFTMMPGIDTVKIDSNSRRLSYTHDNEETSPYYYGVTMDAGSGRNIKGEMTATSRSSVVRFTYPENETSNIYMEMTRSGIAGKVEIDPIKGEISGYNTHRMDSHLSNIPLDNFKGYYVLQFSKPFKTYGTTVGNTQSPNNTRVVNNNVGAFVTFDTIANEAIEVRVGSSFISVDQARKNLEQEVPSSLSFEDVKNNLKNEWETLLSRIEIEGASDDDMTIFYTGLYHAMLFPSEFSEYGRYYSAYDDSIHLGESYTSYSLWDTFRAENSLITLLAPERVDGMVQSLLQNYQQGGYMPKWPNPSYTNIMIGTPADSIVAEAIVKGFTGFDYDLAYEACFKDGMVPPVNDDTTWWGDRQNGVPYEARAGLTYLLEKGYIPVDKTAEAASNTLEGAYEDWCIAQVAKAVGKEDDYKYFINRSQAYKNMYNPATGLLQGKNYNGNFASGGWTEASQMNYAYCVLQDFAGLQSLMNTYQPETYNNSWFTHRLDQYFTNKENSHDNEPSHHYAYIYGYAGQPWKTQKLVREIAKKEYANHPALGLTGNEDCGQMSAWYILSSLGFYSVNPASAEYVIGSPFFSKATIHSGSNKFEIIANNNSDENIYIQSAELNESPLNKPILTHEDIVNGGSLVLEMGNTASTWGASYTPQSLPTYENVQVPEVPEFMKHPTKQEPIDDRNLALTAVSTSTTQQSGLDVGGEAIRINDGKLTTGIVSTDNCSFPQYITLTWDEPKSFNQMNIIANYGVQQAPKNWDIEVSANGIDNWINIKNSGNINWTGSTQENMENITVDFDSVEDVKGFRIKINSANMQWGHFAFRELEIYNIISDPNLALKAVCTADSERSGMDVGGEAIRLNDGKLTTGIVMNSTMPQYVTLKWNTPQTFNSMKLIANWCRDQAPYNWDIEVSEDGVSGWQLIKNSGDINWKTSSENDMETTEIIFPTVNNVKGFRIKITKANLSWGHMAFRELEIYNKEESESSKISVGEKIFYKNSAEKGNEIISLTYGKVIGSINVFAGDSPKNVEMILALYDKTGKLVKLEHEQKNITIDMPIIIDMDIPDIDLLGYRLTMMLWDDSSLEPLTTKSSIQ